MRFAYADPPYFGYAEKFYGDRHPEAAAYDKIETHAALIVRLSEEFPDGWALSMTSGNLKDILPLCPADARVAAWVKPFCSFKPNVNPAYAWEPVVFRGGAQGPRGRDRPRLLRRPDHAPRWVRRREARGVLVLVVRSPRDAADG
jgi:hypothetical protein